MALLLMINQKAHTIAHELIDKNLKEIQYEIGITSTKNNKWYLDKIVDEIEKMKWITSVHVM